MLAWVVALVFGALAAGFYARVRSINVELGEARISEEKLTGELQASRAQLEREAAKLRRKSDELAELRKRHDKLKKRTEGAPAKGGADRAELAGAAGERVLEQARQERDRAREEVESLTGELEAARASLAAAKPAAGSLTAAEGQRLRDEAKRAQDALADARTASLKAEEQVTRLKRRLEAQETAYVALRGELEAKKDRLATQAEQIERLRALKVALTDTDIDADLDPDADEQDDEVAPGS